MKMQFAISRVYERRVPSRRPFGCSGLEAIVDELAKAGERWLSRSTGRPDSMAVLFSYQRMLVYPGGWHSLFSRLACINAIVGSDVAFFDQGRLATGVSRASIQMACPSTSTMQPSLARSFLPLTHPALPDGIVASVQFGELAPVGVNVTDEILALRHSELAKLQDMTLTGSGDLPRACRTDCSEPARSNGSGRSLPSSAGFRLPAMKAHGSHARSRQPSSNPGDRVYYGLSMPALAPGL